MHYASISRQFKVDSVAIGKSICPEGDERAPDLERSQTMRREA
jgi:hypothetical protein